MTTREETTRTSDVGGRQRPDEGERPQLDETKQALKTSEFWLCALLLLGLIIAGAVSDGFDAGRVWRYITILAVGYLLSRGFAKALRGRSRGTETKPFFKTTEFFVLAAALIGLLISGAVSSGEGTGEVDTLRTAQVWQLATWLVVGYAVSRGLSKSGAGAQSHADRGGGGLPIGDRVKAAAEAFSGGESGSGAGAHRGGGEGAGAGGHLGGGQGTGARLGDEGGSSAGLRGGEGTGAPRGGWREPGA